MKSVMLDHRTLITHQILAEETAVFQDVVMESKIKENNATEHPTVPLPALLLALGQHLNPRTKTQPQQALLLLMRTL